VDREGGKVSNGKVFAEMPKPSITDGVRTDTAGNVWCSCGWGDPNDDGVRCYNAAGDPAKSIFRKRSPICASDVTFRNHLHLRLERRCVRSIPARPARSLDAMMP
jgi:sugar lactone lactonase YvrE